MIAYSQLISKIQTDRIIKTKVGIAIKNLFENDSKKKRIAFRI